MGKAWDINSMPMIQDDSDAAAAIPKNRVCGRIPRDYSVDGFGSGAHSIEWDREPFTLDEIKDRINEAEKAGEDNITRNKDAGLGPKDQDGISYCWVNAPCWLVEATRVKQGNPHVSLSPASVGAPIKNYQNQGGWGTQACEYGAEHGFVPSSMWGDNAIDRKLDTPESREIRKYFKIEEYYDLPNKRDPLHIRILCTCLLVYGPVGVGLDWWGHEVSVEWVTMKGGKLVFPSMNSWGDNYGDGGRFVLSEEKVKASDAVCIRAVTSSGAA